MNYSSGTTVAFWQPFKALMTEHRGLIRSMVAREVTNRYKGSIVGFGWAFINPIVMMIIFTVIFSGLFNARFGTNTGPLSYAVYLFCGLMPWIAFSDGVLRSTTSITDNVNFVKRVVFPLEALPVNVALAALFQQLVGTLIVIVAALIIEGSFHFTIIFLPVLIAIQLIATLGIGWLAASLGVFVRDMPQFNQLTFMAWMYLTPIFYPENIVPEKYKPWINMNPIAPLIRSYRLVILEGKMPDWNGLSVTVVFALVFFAVGFWWFERTKKAFADVI